MGRVLQKKKNKSSLPKVRRKPKSKRINIRSNPIVAANWSSSQTLAQNYIRLGLTSRLNARAGGTEPPTNLEDSHPDSLSIASKSAAGGGPKTLIPSTARVIRDPVTGAITKVVHGLSSSSAAEDRMKNPLNDPLCVLDDSDDGGNTRQFGGGRQKGESGGSIVHELEAAARAGGGGRNRPRMPSRREAEWIERLVRRWGDNFDAMVLDRRLNPGQQSAGDLRKRVKRWKDGGGGEIVVET